MVGIEYLNDGYCVIYKGNIEELIRINKPREEVERIAKEHLAEINSVGADVYFHKEVELTPEQEVTLSMASNIEYLVAMADLNSLMMEDI